MDDILYKPYVPEVNDCFQTGRKYFAFLGINIRDYAFPSDFWDYEDSMYERLFEREGFYNVDTDTWKPQVSDVLLVPGSWRVSFPTHIGIVVEDNQVLHHYTGRRCELTPFKGAWRTPTRVLRHESLRPEATTSGTSTLLQLKELMPDHVKRRLESKGPKPPL